jgi:hypothetical protein
MVNAIFLDIDGVMLPFGGVDDNAGNSFPRSCLSALNNILQSVPNTVVVLSSTWRVDARAIQLIIDEFSAFGGSLPQQIEHMTDPLKHHIRQHEIVDWLQVIAMKQGMCIEKWCILDDDEEGLYGKDVKYREICDEHVVLVESSIGLTQKDAIKAIEILQPTSR